MCWQQEENQVNFWRQPKPRVVNLVIVGEKKPKPKHHLIELNKLDKELSRSRAIFLRFALCFHLKNQLIR